MKKKFRKHWKQVLSIMLTVSMVIQMGSPAAEAKAAKAQEYIYLEAATMPDEIMAADSFYVGTTSADLEESADAPYLLKIGRGGKGDKAASVVLKISDATASYGTDYEIRSHESGLFTKESADSPSDNQSLLDIISENDVTEEVLQDGEDESDDTSAESLTENYFTKVLEDRLSQMEDSDEASASPDYAGLGESANKAVKNTTEPASGDYANNALAQAKEKMTGVESDRETVTSTQQDITDSLSDIGDYLTEAVPGATLTVDFAEGETEKYVEIDTINNKKSDGTRTFYITLSEPSEGMTNSSVSESIFSIIDDEPEEDAVVSFSKAKYTAEEKQVEVVVERTGAIAQTVQVTMTSEADTAVSGRDFSPVNAAVTFPFGIKKRTLKISVQNDALTSDAAFRLKLSEDSGAKVGDIGETTVVIPAAEPSAAAGDDGDTAQDSEEEEEVSAQASLTEVKYGNNVLNNSSWSVVRGSNGVWFSGTQLKAKVKGNYNDVKVNLSGTSQRTTMYIYDGFRTSWTKESRKSSYSEANIAYYAKSDTDRKIFVSTGDRPRFGWEERGDYYFGDTDATAVKFYNYNWKGAQNIMTVDWVKPILRPFQVRVKAADTLSFYQSNGKLAADASVTTCTLQDQESKQDYAIKYAGDKMVITATNTKGLSKLSGVRIWNEKQNDSKKIDQKYLNGFKEGDTSVSVSLTNEFCEAYKDYIYYNSNGGDRKKGNITLQPVFSYVDAKITINKKDEIMGNGQTVDASVNIFGKKVEYGKEYTYHQGDILRFTTTVSGKDYTATGLDATYWHKNVRKTYTDTWNYSNGSRDQYLDNASYTIVPSFSENDNRVVVRINKNDVAKFSQTGIFASTYFSKYATEGNGYYDIEVVSTSSVQTGVQYTLAAETISAYIIPVWKETNNSNYYMGSSFAYTAKSRRTANIVYLYAAKTSQKYGSLKGTLYYENYTLLTKSAGESILPAQGGCLSGAGEAAFADEDGKVQTYATPLAGVITVSGMKVTLGSKGYPLCVRTLATASGATEYKDVTLKMSGVTQKVSDADGNQIATYVTDLGALTIRTNTADADAPTFSQISTKNKNKPQYVVYMNGESTSIEVTAADTDTEKVKAVTFLIYDANKNTVKSTIEAKKNDSNNWEMTRTFLADGSEKDSYDEGDRIFVQMTTDKSSILTGSAYASDIKKIPQSVKNELNKTVYAPVNTGYTLIKSGLYEQTTTQSIDMGSLEGMSGLPLIGNFNANLSVGPVQLSTEQLYDDKENVVGTRIKVGLDMNFDKTSVKSAGSNLAQDGKNYGNFLTKLGNLKGSYQQAKESLKGYKGKNMTSFGGQNWGIHPIVGFYMDFGIKTKNDTAGVQVDKYLVVQGGGIYLGGNGKYSVTWYALVPVVYIPCYFGVSGELTLLLQAGAATTVSDETEETKVDDYLVTSHNLSEELDFDFQLSAALTVQVYCGVGICGTLGVRGGLQFDANFIWYPTLAKQNSYFKTSTGMTINLSFKMWVDLLLFTVTIPAVTLASKDWGLNKDYSDLKKKNTTDLNKLLSATDTTKNTTTVNKLFNATDTTKKGSANSSSSTTDASAVTYQLKERDNTPSSWSGSLNLKTPDEVKTMATYKEKNSTTLIDDGYDNPDSQMLDMGEYGTLLVFLQEDTSRTDEERTAVSYSVYKDGEYSDPVIIQTDGTADFQPNICEAGDNMIISWISSDPDVDKGKSTDDGYEKTYLESQEVYTVMVSKKSLAASEKIDQDSIVRLTDDEWYNSEPTAVYDESTGDYNVYYVATAEDDGEEAEASDFANPMNANGATYSVMIYRVYDASEGKWLVTDFEEDEKPNGYTDEEFEEQLETYGGQRFLSSPIEDEDVDMQDPLISDFTGIAYNGLGVFAYTIDKDNDADTDTDRDLFLQLYDFESRSTFVPIRITNDDTTDTMPQLVRKGGDKDGTTYLFWKSDNTLHYIDVSSLVKYGVDENGNIKESALSTDSDEEEVGSHDEPYDESLTEDDINALVYKFTIDEVQPYGEEENQTASYNQYQVAVDSEDNIYVVYVDNGSDVSKGESASQEIFATAMIDTEVQKSAAEIDEDTEVDNDKGDLAESDTTENNVKKWSPANQLTDTGEFCDGPALAINDEGTMVMVYNRYDMASNGETETNDDGETSQSVSIIDMKYASSILEPYGSVEATEISLSDTTPEVGDTVDVDITFENTGLIASKNGFKAVIYQQDAEGTKKKLGTYRFQDSLVPADNVSYSLSFKADEDTVGSRIVVETVESDLEGTSINKSDKFIEAAEYSIISNDSYQGEDSKFYTEVEVQNTGNADTSTGDKLQVEFAGPYADASYFGVTEEILAQEDISLEAGESTTVTLELDVPASAFNYYGKIQTKAKVVNSKDEEYTGAELEDPLYMSQPAELSINDGKDVTLNQGESTDITFNYVTIDSLSEIAPMIVSDDQSVVTVEDGKLTAVGAGTTTVTAYAYPYNAFATIDVTVIGDYTAEEDNYATEEPASQDTTAQDTTAQEGTAVESPAAGTPAAETPAATTALGKASISKMASDTGKKLTVSWDAVSGAKGYIVTYATNKKFTKGVKTKTVKKNTVTLKKLKSKPTYYIKVKAYTGQGSSKVYGEESAVRYIKLSPRPAKTGGVTASPKAKGCVVSVSSVKKATGFEVVLAKDAKGKKVVSTTYVDKKKVTLSQLKGNTTYYVFVRSYAKTKDGGYLFANTRKTTVTTQK